MLDLPELGFDTPSSVSRTLGGEASSPITGRESRSTRTWHQSLKKLSPEQVSEAVALYETGWSCGALGKRYSVSRQSMWDLLRRRTTLRPKLRYGTDNHFWRGTQASGEAQNKLEAAIKRGEVERQTTCERCGATGTFKDGRSKIQAHHSDYMKPLKVMWLCQPCHHEWHRVNRAKGVTPVEASRGSTSFAEASPDPARTSPSPADEQDSQESVPASSTSSPASLSLFDPDGFSSRTFPVSSLLTAVGTSEQSLERWPTSGTAWPGGFSTHATSECRSDEGGCSSSEPSLAEILEEPQKVPARYSLSARAASGILRRAEKRGKSLPSHLEAALTTVAEGEPDTTSTTTPTS